MEGRRRRPSADKQLYKIVLISSIVGSLINCTILTISVVSGKWIFGNGGCQLFGLLSQVLVAGSAWMIALAAIEGIYKTFIPTEHPSTFSEINLKILTYGIYLLLGVLHTAPLYGWGEYSNLRGNINLEVFMTGASSIPPPSEEKPNSFVLIIGTQDPNVTCSHENSTVLPLKPEAIGQVMTMFIRSVYECEIRVKVAAVWTLILRFVSGQSLDLFYEDYTSGKMLTYIQKELLKNFDSCNASFSQIIFAFDLRTERYGAYKDAHISFQDIGICSLDYSSTNSTVISWIPCVIITSVLIPYIITLVAGIALSNSTAECRRTVYLAPPSLIAGSLLCLTSTVPYYYINILSYIDVPISHELNVAFTAVYFSHSMLFVFLTTCYGCWRGHVFPDTDVESRVNISLNSINSNQQQFIQRRKDNFNN